jgi:hypothetical protein
MRGNRYAVQTMEIKYCTDIDGFRAVNVLLVAG